MSANVTPPSRTETVDRLRVNVFPTRAALGAAAGAAVAERVRQLLAVQPAARMIFAAAPSQDETLAALGAARGIDWGRVVAFHMDEYLGLSAGSAQSFGRYLRAHLFDHVRPGVVHFIDGSTSPAAERRRYAALLAEGPIDIVCLGIGENGHLAFNDPPVADFADPEAVKVVALDAACRQQQVNDGCFPSPAAVPTHALTLTIPTLMAGARLFCAVPGPAKRAAVRRALRGPVATDCPASVLRRHPDCTLYLDADSDGT